MFGFIDAEVGRYKLFIIFILILNFLVSFVPFVVRFQFLIFIFSLKSPEG